MEGSASWLPGYSNSAGKMIKSVEESACSPIRKQAADALRRARKLPVGSDRNDLRQLAIGLLWLERKGLQGKVMDREAALSTLKDPKIRPQVKAA